MTDQIADWIRPEEPPPIEYDEKPRLEPCQDCGGETIPTGSCTTCVQCGSSGGCG